MNQWIKNSCVESMEQLSSSDLEEVLELGKQILKKRKTATTTPQNCLFCQHESEDMEANLEHMSIAHSFFIPDMEYCTSVEGLLNYLGSKVRERKMCLWCNEKRKAFYDVQAVQKHMRDKGHCKMRLHTDTSLAYGPFYDFCSKLRQNDAEPDPDEVYQLPQPQTNNDTEQDDEDEDEKIEWVEGNKNGVGSCGKCGQEVAWKNWAKHAEVAHHPNNKFRCMQCPTRYATKKGLDTHIGMRHSQIQTHAKLSKYFDYTYEVFVIQVYKFGKLYGTAIGFGDMANFGAMSRIRKYCSKKELTPENGYTTAHETIFGTGITGNDKQEIKMCKGFARRLISIAKRVSVVSPDTCLQLSAERKAEIQEKLLEIPLLHPYVRERPVWIDEGTTNGDATDSDEQSEEEDE